MTQTEIFSFVVQTLYWFFLYGCIGWGVEVVYAAIKERRLVNRGFLCGPICPIYGCGMVVLNWTVAALAPSGEGKSVSTVAVFFVGMVLTTAIELVGGWTLFKIYHIRWWDYSNMKFNIGGYICPQFSLLWGLGSVIMVKVVHPALAKASSPLPMKVLVPAANLLVNTVMPVIFWLAAIDAGKKSGFWATIFGGAAQLIMGNAVPGLVLGILIGKGVEESGWNHVTKVMMAAIVLLFVLSGRRQIYDYYQLKDFDMKMIESFHLTVPNWLDMIHNSLSGK